MFLVLVRLGGIALGVITLLGFASGYLNVEFKPVFASVLKVLQEVAAVMVGAPLWEMLLDELRQHFAWVPKPDAHWKPIYTLSALLMVSMAWRLPWFMFPIALACSLVPAVLAGTMPIGSAAVAFWPIAGIFAFVAILGPPDRGMALRYAALAAHFAFGGYFLGPAGEGTVSLLVLAVFVGSMGVAFLWCGLSEAEDGTLSLRLQDPDVAMGLGIVATLGGALALGYLLAA